MTSLLFASDSVLLSGSADNTTRIWDVASGEVRREIQHPRTVFGIAASQVERNAPQPFFATACWDGVVRLFSLPLGDPRGELHGHSGGLYSVAISPLDDSLLASAGADLAFGLPRTQRQPMLRIDLPGCFWVVVLACSKVTAGFAGSAGLPVCTFECGPRTKPTAGGSKNLLKVVWARGRLQLYVNGCLV